MINVAIALAPKGLTYEQVRPYVSTSELINPGKLCFKTLARNLDGKSQELWFYSNVKGVVHQLKDKNWTAMGEIMCLQTASQSGCFFTVRDENDRDVTQCAIIRKDISKKASHSK